MFSLVPTTHFKKFIFYVLRICEYLFISYKPPKIPLYRNLQFEFRCPGKSTRPKTQKKILLTYE